jgi:hypothetical protein
VNLQRSQRYVRRDDQCIRQGDQSFIKGITGKCISEAGLASLYGILVLFGKKGFLFAIKGLGNAVPYNDVRDANKYAGIIHQLLQIHVWCLKANPQFPRRVEPCFPSTVPAPASG